MVFNFEHGHLQRQVNLRRREPHAAVFPHGLDHVVEQSLKFRRGDFGRIYGIGASADYRMTESCDLQDHVSYRRSSLLAPLDSTATYAEPSFNVSAQVWPESPAVAYAFVWRPSGAG